MSSSSGSSGSHHGSRSSHGFADEFDNLRYDVLTMSRGVTIQQRMPDSDDVAADKIWYMLEKAIAANPWMSYTILSTVTAVCLTLLGALWQEAADADPDGDHAGTNDSWGSGVYTAFQVFATGGIDNSIVSNYQRVVYALMVAFGLVFFSILIGFITDAVSSSCVFLCAVLDLMGFLRLTHLLSFSHRLCQPLFTLLHPFLTRIYPFHPPT